MSKTFSLDLWRTARFPAFWLSLTIVLILTTLFSLIVGRYAVPITHVIGILFSPFSGIDPYWTSVEQRVVELIRLPRIILALVAGAGLAISGAALQGVFRNPLVGPQIIGVSSGAAFGGALGILLSESSLLIISLAFIFGMAAIMIVYFISRMNGRAPILMLVLSGVVTGAFFMALVSLVKFVADPDDKLPAIVFWLMGSFASASYDKVTLVAIPVTIASAVIYFLRFRINVLSLGDEEAKSLGIGVEQTRWIILVCVALVSAAVVSAAGIIGWVGLVIPHVARMMVGPDHRVLLPASALIGAIYLILVDNFARASIAAEIPLGIITAIIGAPIFAILLRRTQAKGWQND
ncbi:MAG: iron ABC transporter permease [Rhodospirillaceae bacterium]|nr:iron ABC transporter permease [Rhodospirillaceae bacterium]MBT8001750.1 iron ABC transporter permease [Rhodospirillales bacterium]MBT4699672.1 iron ABC transporter permease [Rhodospirillaceae bacterium]MBT5034427.1 iron ABC transporter permease [Rhodospirillaceae bacterium]MBT6218393.1 iron ABC transporter permease [Rhodospirillaceae bacterium]